MFEFGSYSIAAWLFPKLLGLIYFISFGAFVFQIKGLLGKRGILPVENFLNFFRMRLEKRRYYLVPSLYWLKCSDRALMLSVILGSLCGLALFFNPYPLLTPVLLVILYLLQLSLVSVGQDFLGFGWEIYMLEVTIVTFFISLSSPPNPVLWFTLNFILFAVHFQGGASKLLSHDVNWRNLTAVAYHYQTQPIPNCTAWYIHKFPLWFHKASCLYMFFVELIVPFGIFGTEEVRLITFFLFASLQIFIFLTGNFSYLNHLTLVLSLILISDRFLKPFFSIPKSFGSIEMDIFLYIVGFALLAIQLIAFWNYLFSNHRFALQFLARIEPFHIVSRHGIFAVMTTKRYEIVVEGSNDGVTWKEYGFYWKPSECCRRPRRISPYQPRLDWMVWFLPFSRYNNTQWFYSFLVKLLEGSPEVLKLLRTNPFPEHPPLYVRALIYDYVFSDRESKKQTGQWWKRTLVGTYSPTLTLKQQTYP